jgi:cytochrome c biogenesis protein
MPKSINQFRQFFASVKLALITLIVLAVTSIIGTLIKQDQAPAYYVQEYGPTLARLFEAMDITNMYRSWWFVALLLLFAVNLVVCSIERLPAVWRLMTMDNLGIDPRQLEKMSFTHREEMGLMPGAAAEQVQKALAGSGWKNLRRMDGEESVLLFAQRGAWTRLGVYVVHLSILVILAGVVIGSFFGYQAYVYLPEGRATDKIFMRKTKEPVPLGFNLRNDRFEKAFYPDGSVREYRADLTVFDSERDTPYRKSVIVNDPLAYHGLTFYMGDSFPLDEYFVIIRNRATGEEEAFRVPPNRDVAWRENGAFFHIEELNRDEDGAVRQAKIRFAGGGAAGEQSVFWLEDKGSAAVGRPGEDFTIYFRQLHSTLLLVKKDPGVSTLFSGCVLMIVGLAVSFFLSHRRIWVRIMPEGKQRSRILFAGASNKNQLAFERRFRELTTRIGTETGDANAAKGCPLISARSQ